ncbi:B-cell receptor CD22-like, partial [Cyprinus carpio]|uniref:B-cell receptor CD22-like n=1 Tax=Cyprinus carpio TaxID=7962 RepID=A0A9R0AST2_CYPCA
MCINTERPKPVLKVSPDERVFSGETVTLTCDIQRAGDIQWTYSWFKDGNPFYPHTTTTTTTTAKISFSADKSDRAEYSCRGERSDSQRSDTSAAVRLTVSGECSCSHLFNDHLHQYFLFININTHMCIYTERPKAVVKVSPDERVFRGETVTLTCDIQRAGDIQWTYSWFKDGSVIRDVTERLYSITSVSDRAEYSCRGERSDSQRSDTSAAVTLTVSGECSCSHLFNDHLHWKLRQQSRGVSPQPWLTGGDSVTLICEVTRAPLQAGPFSWFRIDDRVSDLVAAEELERLLHTLRSAALQHYRSLSRAEPERGRPDLYTRTVAYTDTVDH